RSRVRIPGLPLWLPPGSDAPRRLRAGDAAAAVRRISGDGVNASVTPRAGETRPFAADPARWCAESPVWATAFPAIHERRGKLDLKEVARWCRHAGLPEPSAFRAARGPLVPGAVDLAPVEVNRPGRVGRPYSHVELRFPQAVRGPVVIGAGRQRGFGLCVPVKV
ncbi:MAG: type I-U CRISPR-associated protein Csb2, partial [Rhodospirillales bacterium]|nr:type I-U CRISPR-associated protein Csb2 [Rhodospirillales bacterium]